MANYKDVEPELSGMWQEFLITYGIFVDDFKGMNTKNGPCPLCGGSDRAHWRRQGGRVALYCRGCTDGSMKSSEDVIMDLANITFNELVDDMASFVNHVPVEQINRAMKRAKAMPTKNMPIDHHQDHVKSEAFLKQCEWTNSPDLLAQNISTPYMNPRKNNIDYWIIENAQGVLVNMAKYNNGQLSFLAGGQSYGSLHTIYGGKRTIICVDPIDGILLWYKTRANVLVAFTIENLRYCLKHRKDISPVACLRNKSEYDELKDYDFDVRIITGDAYSKIEISQ